MYIATIVGSAANIVVQLEHMIGCYTVINLPLSLALCNIALYCKQHYNGGGGGLYKS